MNIDEKLKNRKCSLCSGTLDTDNPKGLFHNNTSECFFCIVECSGCRRLNIFELKYEVFPDEIVQFTSTYDRNADSAYFSGSALSSDFIDVSCAVIEKGDEVLICQRAENKHQGGKWEFPGGKRHAGESAWEALRREILEELDVKVSVKFALAPITHTVNNVSLNLQGFVCEITEGDIKLTDHSNAEWVKIYNIGRYDLLDADYEVLDQYISKRMSR